MLIGNVVPIMTFRHMEMFMGVNTLIQLNNVVQWILEILVLGMTTVPTKEHAKINAVTLKVNLPVVQSAITMVIVQLVVLLTIYRLVVVLGYRRTEDTVLLLLIAPATIVVVPIVVDQKDDLLGVLIVTQMEIVQHVVQQVII